MSEPVFILEYDATWATKFQEERAFILDVVTGVDVIVEHVGSTSVPGLAAKPIIDIMLIVANETDMIRSISPLVLLGYQCRGELGIAGRIYFVKGAPRSHQIHLYPQSNPEVSRHLMFRNYLRAHPERARAYAELKYALAEQYRNDRAGYTEAKTAFIRETEAWARAEQQKEKTTE